MNLPKTIGKVTEATKSYTIEYNRDNDEDLRRFLDNKFGEYMWRTRRSGPKITKDLKCHPSLNLMIIEVVE